VVRLIVRGMWYLERWCGWLRSRFSLELVVGGGGGGSILRPPYNHLVRYVQH